MRPDLPFVTPPFARLTDFLGLWAMEPTAAALLADQVRRLDLSAHVAASMARPQAVVSAMETVPGRGEKRVAIIKATGTLMKPQTSTGGTSTIQLRRDIMNAARDPNVSGILLAVESPGGTIAGTADLANEVTKARQTKPVWAHVDDLAASAAYWMVSQADQVWANNGTALVGNVGTIFAVADSSAAAEKEGVKVRVFTTGALKAAGYPGTSLSDQQAAMFQGLADEAQRHFDAAVKSARRLSADQMKAMQTGEIFAAARAKELNLIDGIRPFAQTLAALADAN